MIYFESEKHFEDLLFDNACILVENCGITESSKIIRQANLHPYGICDLLVVDLYEDKYGTNHVSIDLFELKNTPLKSDHIIQCARYKTFFDNLDIENTEINFHCHLIGMATFKNDPGDLVYLCQSIEWLSVYECTLHPTEGLKFKITEGWGVSIKGVGHKTNFDEKVTSLLNEFKKTEPEPGEEK